MLRELARIEGVYVPSFYRPEYGPDGSFLGVRAEDGVPLPVHSRVVERLRPEWYPENPLVPLTEVVHDRLSVEIMRGCSRGCRFCGAGMTYRPKRVRPVEEVVNHVDTGIRSSGWEEVSLLSLSSSDYPGLADVVDRIGARLSGKAVSISLSSLRVDNFSLAIAANAAADEKPPYLRGGSGITAPPRCHQQKSHRRAVVRNGENRARWRVVGIQALFHVGLPTETDEDVLAIADLLNRSAPFSVHPAGVTST